MRREWLQCMIHYNLTEEEAMELCQPMEVYMTASQKKRLRKHIEDTVDKFGEIIVIHEEKGTPCPRKEWRAAMNCIVKCPKEKNGRGCRNCKCCVHRLMLSLTAICFSSNNNDKVVCGNFGGIFRANPKRYSPEGLAAVSVKDLSSDACDAGLSIYVKNATYAVPVLKFIWDLWETKSRMPHLHESVRFRGFRLKSAAIALQGAIGWCPFVGCDIHVYRNVCMHWVFSLKNTSSMTKTKSHKALLEYWVLMMMGLLVFRQRSMITSVVVHANKKRN